MAQIPAPILPSPPPKFSMGQGVAGPGSELSPVEIKAMLDAISAASPAIEKPTFNVSDLYPKQEAPLNLPLDLRPLAQFTDALYGTRTATNMPDYRGRALEEAQIRKSLEQNNAVKQTEAQARLAEFKTGLDEYYRRQDPVSMLKELKQVMKLSGGDDEVKSLKAQLGLEIKQQEVENRYAKMMNDISGDQRKIANDLAKELSGKDTIQAYDKVRGAAERVRAALLTPTETGLPEYGGVIDFIKTLDPQSTVMYSEAESLKKSQGLYHNMMNLANQWYKGQNLGPASRRDMIRMVREYEKIAEKTFDRTISEFEGRAKTQNVPSEAVIGPIQSKKSPSNESYTFRYMVDGKPKGARVKYENIEDFLAAYPDAEAVTVRGQ